MNIHIKTLLALCLFFIVQLFVFSNENYASIHEVGPFKNWSVIFSNSIDSSTLTEDAIIVTNSKGERQDITVKLVTPKKIEIQAPMQGYKSNETYLLSVHKTIQSTNGRQMKSSKALSFHVLDLAITFEDRGISDALKRHFQSDNDHYQIGQLQTIESLFTFGVEQLDNIEYMTNLKKLNLHEHQMSNIENITSLPQLEVLEMSYSLKYLDITPLQKLTNLTELNLIGNLINDVGPLQSLHKLEYLNLAYNNVHDATPLSALTNLKELSLENFKKEDLNTIMSIDFIHSLKKLEYLMLRNNFVEDITPLLQLPQLKKVDLRGNPLNQQAIHVINTLRTAGVEVLHDSFPTQLLIPDVQLEKALRNHLDKKTGEITLQDLQSLTSLDLFSYNITDLTGLQYATQLIELTIGEGNVSDLTPIIHLPHLKQLNILANPLTDVTHLTKMEALESLSLNKIPVQDISFLLEIPNLKEVDVRGLALGEDAKDTILAIHNSGIVIQHAFSRDLLSRFLEYVSWNTKYIYLLDYGGKDVDENKMIFVRDIDVLGEMPRAMTLSLHFHSGTKKISHLNYTSQYPINGSPQDVLNYFNTLKDRFSATTGLKVLDIATNENDAEPMYIAKWSTMFENAELRVYYSTQHNGMFVQLTISPI